MLVSKIPKFYGMENITTEEVMDKLEILIFELHNIKRGTSSKYVIHEKYFLHMKLYLMKTILVR